MVSESQAMVIRVSEIPEEGLRFGGPEAFPEPFQDRAWRLEDVELAVEKDGNVVYDHDQVDRNALLETETTLGLPMKPLCSEGCRGLCPTCGANRNTAPCACAPAADPRWSPLKSLADRLSK